MDTKNVYLRWIYLALFAVFITGLLGSCSFCPNVISKWCDLLPDTSQPAELTAEDQNVVFEELGTIIVYHGFGCAESNKSGMEDFLMVEQSLDIPLYATNATVFLNGWHLKYLHKDHEVAGIGTLIRKIRLENQTLKWEALGAISDKNFDDAYSWCYHYTVVAWNSSSINLTVDHKDGCGAEPSGTNFFSTVNKDTTTALSNFPTFLQNPDFSASKTVALLPRGFVFSWDDIRDLACDDLEDHHLLQIGYNMDHSEIFAEKGKIYKKKSEDMTLNLSLPNSASQVDSGYVSWETSTIFKDNKARRDYMFGEIVSGLGGSDLGIIQPPFSILPLEDHEGIFSTCVSSGSGMKTEEVVIENIPYEYAIPMLTGWQLSYACGDQHVKEIGIWIDEIHYEKDSNIQTGTLSYRLSSILKDKNNDPAFGYRHKVTVLGLKAVPRVIPSVKSPDLLPFSPSGTNQAAFCRLEDGGKLLRVSVKNQGNADAGTSKTMVLFGDVSVVLETPPIPMGGSVDLLFKVPLNCISHDCSFTITVDSDNQVHELNKEGNNSANGVCIG